MSSATPQIVLFFDGVCGLCNHLVNFLMAHDHGRRLRYAPLQGETFRAVASENPQLVGIDSLVVTFREPGGCTRVLVRSRAALFAFKQLGGGWKILATLLQLVPRPIADAGYRIVAKTRYRFFGKHDACRLPTATERALFLS